MSDGYCRYCGQIEAAPGTCCCPSLPAHEYWQRRGRKERPATVRLMTPSRVCQPESIDEQFYRDRDRGFKTWTDSDDNLRMVQGYPSYNI